MMAGMSYTRQQVLKLAAEVDCDPRTVEKWCRGEPVSSGFRYALDAAAKKLKLPLPTDSAEGAA
jgi:hypothetical protein